MKISENIKSFLGLDTDIETIVYSKSGIKAHLYKRKHYRALKYLDDINEIITKPDYVGVNQKNSGLSLEFIKCYNDNVLVAVKLNKDKSSFYVASMYTINDFKLNSRVNSGRIKKIDKCYKK